MFRDGIRCIWALRPLHHRDVSVYNLLLRVDDLNDGEAEAARMEPVLEWTDGPVAPRLTTMIIDYDRSRFGEEPTDFQRRRAFRALGQADPDMSIDDAITGTISVMSRAQQQLLLIAEETNSSDELSLGQIIRKMGVHRHWHDVESLCLCLLFAFLTRYESKSDRLARILDGWFDTNPVNVVEEAWLTGVLASVAGPLIWRPQLSRGAEKEGVNAFKKWVRELEAVFRWIKPVNVSLDSQLTAMGESIFGEVDSGFWQKMLEVAISGIEKFEAFEAKQLLAEEEEVEKAFRSLHKRNPIINSKHTINSEFHTILDISSRYAPNSIPICHGIVR